MLEFSVFSASDEHPASENLHMTRTNSKLFAKQPLTISDQPLSFYLAQQMSLPSVPEGQPE